MNTTLLFNQSGLQNLAFPIPGPAPRAFGVPRTAPLGALRTSSTRTRNILVPLDGSPFAEHAIPMALAMAEQCNAVLHLVHVVVPAELLDPYDALYFADASLDSLKRDKHRYLEELSRRISATSSISVASRIIQARDVSTSLDEAPGLEADFVVMATHGRGALGRLWLGSVTHSLLRKTSVPVIVVRGSNSPVSFAPQPVENMLLPLGNDSSSEKVLTPFLDLGIFPSARHTLLQVVGMEPKYLVQSNGMRTAWVPSWRRWVSAKQSLYTVATKLRDRHRRVQTKVIGSDEPIGQVVLRHTERESIDLVAVAYQRRGPLSRLLRPSTCEYLFRRATRPVMFVPIEAVP